MARLTSRTSVVSESAARFLGEINEILGQPLATDSRFIDLLEATPDPHAAALGLLRVLEAAGDSAHQFLTAVRSGDSGDLAEDELDRPLLSRFLRVMGSTEAMVDHLVRHPEAMSQLLEKSPYLMTVRSAVAEAAGVEIMR